MNTFVKAIRMTCSNNPDLNGLWTKQDMEDELKYLEQSTANDAWMNHLFGHVFADYETWTNDIERAFVNGHVYEMVVIMNGMFKVKIEKVFRL